MKKLLKILFAVFMIFVLVMAGGLFYLSRGLETGKNVAVSAVNPSTLKDGTYMGKYSAGRFSNEVNVTVKGGKITKIDLVKDVTFNKPEWTKELFDKIIEKQDIKVDIISGATVTSKAYMKSIEDALKNSIVKK